MSTSQLLSEMDAEFSKVVAHLKQEYSKLQMGRANPSLIENLTVEVYGTIQPLKGLANVSVPDPRTLQIQPWDKSTISNIEKAIMNANLNLNPMSDGIVLRVVIPALTQERRQELAKVVHTLAEEARISLRNIRQTGISGLKEMEKNKEISEDELFGSEKKLQEKTDKFNHEIGEMAKKKETELMTI